MGNAVLGTPGLIRGLISLLSGSLNPFNSPERQRIKMIVKYWAEPITERKGYCWMAIKSGKHNNRYRIRWLTSFLSICLHSRLVSGREAILRHASLQMCEWFSFLIAAGLSYFHLSLSLLSLLLLKLLTLVAVLVVSQSLGTSLAAQGSLHGRMVGTRLNSCWILYAWFRINSGPWFLNYDPKSFV